MSAEYLGMSPEDITAYIMGGMVMSGPKAAPRPSFERPGSAQDDIADIFGENVAHKLKTGERTEADLNAREKAALELQREIQALRREIADEDDEANRDLVL